MDLGEDERINEVEGIDGDLITDEDDGRSTYNLKDKSADDEDREGDA